LAAQVSALDAHHNGSCSILGTTVTGGNRAGKSFRYTPFGEVEEVTECADGSTFATAYQYDGFGRQSVIRYPTVNTSQLAVGYHYTGLGYLYYLTDDSSGGGLLWQAKAMNVLGQVTDEVMRNGVQTVSTRNALTGWLLGSTATAHADNDNIIHGFSYGFDRIGNLLTRARGDTVNGVTSTETFTYDLTNRLTASRITTSGGYIRDESYGYDSLELGNLVHKTGSNYTYAGCQAGSRPAGPHAVCTVGLSTPFGYDGNGNLESSPGRSVTYNTSNKVTHIESAPDPSQGNDTGVVDFMYGADGDRVVQAATNGDGVTTRTVYVGLGATGKSLYERTTTGTDVQHVHYVYAGSTHGGNAFALRVLDNNGAVTENKYYTFDHLGSVVAMSDDAGRVATPAFNGPDATVLGYDAWGTRRNPDGTTAPAASFNLQVGRRQFTGQEQIPNVGLVNMNGRVYDPLIGRFLSPDPHIQFADNLQSYNRYAYAGNNPLRYTDPTGYFWNEMGSFFKDTFTDPKALVTMGLGLGCAIASGGVACVALGVAFAMQNAGIAILQGAAFDRTVLNTAIGLGIGLAAGQLGGSLGLNGWQSLVFGSASAAVTTGISNVVSGGSFFDYNVLGSAMISAASSAATLGVQKVIAISEASAQVQAGGGGASTGQGGNDSVVGSYDPAEYEALMARVRAERVHPQLARAASEGLADNSIDLRLRLGLGVRTPAGLSVFAGSEFDTTGESTLVLRLGASTGSPGVTFGSLANGRTSTGVSLYSNAGVSFGSGSYRYDFVGKGWQGDGGLRSFSLSAPGPTAEGGIQVRVPNPLGTAIAQGGRAVSAISTAAAQPTPYGTPYSAFFKLLGF
jgi:RHS repeat-associated protein